MKAFIRGVVIFALTGAAQVANAGIQMQGPSFQGLELHGQTGQRAANNGVAVDDVQVPGSALGSAGSHGTQAQEITLQGISLNGPELQGITLQGITLQGITLQGITLQGITLQGITLQGTAINGQGVEDVAHGRCVAPPALPSTGVSVAAVHVVGGQLFF